MHPTSLTPNELSALTALGQMPPVKRPADVARVVAAFGPGVPREVAALLLGDPSGEDASDEARDIAWAIGQWVRNNRQRAADRGLAAR